MSHKPSGRLPLLSARPAVSPATLKRAATNFAAWWTEAQWVWTVCLRLYPTASRLRFEPRPFCAWVQHANHSATEPPASIKAAITGSLVQNLFYVQRRKLYTTYGRNMSVSVSSYMRQYIAVSPYDERETLMSLSHWTEIQPEIGWLRDITIHRNTNATTQNIHNTYQSSPVREYTVQNIPRIPIRVSHMLR